MRPLHALDSLWLDVVYAARSFRTQLGMAATIVLVLAAVIGLNMTLFTVLAGIAWRPWPGISNPNEVVRLYLRDPSGQAAGFSLVDARALGRAQSLASVAAMRNETVRVGAGDAVSPRGALMVSGHFFSLLGVTFAHGRGFLGQEDQVGAPAAVAVISHAYWQSSFGGNPAVLGSPIQINDTPFTIVGVVASDFGSAEPAYDKSVFLPTSAYPLLNPQEPAYQSLLRDSTQCCADVIGRLAPGATRERAQAELDVLSRGFARFRQSATGSRDRHLIRVAAGTRGFCTGLDDGGAPNSGAAIGVVDRLRQCRESAVITSGRARRRDWHAPRARRQPRSHRQAAAD